MKTVNKQQGRMTTSDRLRFHMNTFFVFSNHFKCKGSFYERKLKSWKSIELIEE